MTKIKICGLTRSCEIDFVNKWKPDFAGFVIHVPKSRRSLSADQVRLLRQRLNPAILPVGVFVNAPVGDVAELLNDGTISYAQLHGQEDHTYIERLKELTKKPLIQAFSISSKEDICRAVKSPADYILLDNGAGGTGVAFNWELALGCTRPFFLAGGLSPHNAADAICTAHPWALDMSSGVESMGNKDTEKIEAAIAAVRRIRI